MTQYIYRILLIYPATEIEGVNAFVKEFIDPAGDDWVELSLSANGSEPLTHGACSFVATREMADLWLTRFADHLGGEVPEGILDAPRDVQRFWMNGAGEQLWQSEGIYFAAAFNDEGETIDANAAFEHCGLKRKTITIGS